VSLAKLIDLEPTFLGNYHVGTGPADPTSYHQLQSVDGAQGVMFTCPKCGDHQVLCWFTNPRNAPMVPPDAHPLPGRWSFSGDTFDVLTISPSIDLSRIDAKNPAHPSRCYWHGFVENGICR
jgi:hypothetical protein